MTVADHLSPVQACKTLAHDGARLLHDGTGTEYATGCRGRAEVEAESVAFVASQTAGLSTATYLEGRPGGEAGEELRTAEDQPGAGHGLSAVPFTFLGSLRFQPATCQKHHARGAI